MDSNEFSLIINHDSDVPKYLQIVNAISNAIAENVLHQGDVLPSVNFICKTAQLSRDTVFKAYSILKDQNVIESVPNKGYYVANETRKVLLVLDTFKAYKEVLYHSFIKNLPDNFIADVQFHHYNIDNFKTIINNSVGKYYKYIVMNFDDDNIPEILTSLSSDKLLLIDWNIHSKSNNNYVFQDFGKAFYEALKECLYLLKKYKETVFVYPTYTNHPIETVSFFIKFCDDYNLKHRIITDVNEFEIEKSVAYISTNDRILGRFLEECRKKNFEPGEDVGFLSYNDTPMKKFIYKGISVISTDFDALGTKSAEFVVTDKPMQHYVPTKLILRESL
ncbi:GntR family transcriptional regulator [Flaviramulus sp. BrNp1-15]|uniref:GntR family transcriptional regulator n=1 Tax=Flaviramulus sp. BrNp1-15 TaxID=2916754 RepID=UPI001EE86D1A|nr:GntR family transcriptional regulator [Flaviramulus sp. BrNp1-15]ULC60723.1 GntR family transcriptional regulator [Flaviramulus sp. BrNp1-15]